MIVCLFIAFFQSCCFSYMIVDCNTTGDDSSFASSISVRPTEIPEKDVFACESFLDEMNQRVSSLQSSLRKFKLSPQVTLDEIYFFRKTISLQHKVCTVFRYVCRKGSYAAFYIYANAVFSVSRVLSKQQ